MQLLLCALLALQLDDSPASTVASGREAAPVVRRVLVIDPTGQSGRTALLSDSVLERLARGTGLQPRTGEALRSTSGEERVWREASLGPQGGLVGEVRGGGWCWLEVEHGRDQVVLLEAQGCSFVYAAGEPRMADLYALGVLRTPIALRHGTNGLLARVGRGQPRFAFSSPPAPRYLDTSDVTLPDLLFGTVESAPATPPERASSPARYLAAIVVVNATEERASGLRLAARVDQGAWVESFSELELLPLETRKVGFAFEAAVDARTQGRLQVELRTATGERLHAVEMTLAVRSARTTHRRTFTSEIDGSVQYYGIVPSSAEPTDPPPALILSLHGASVEASGQAASYAAKPWAHIVAPTNRRPYGFDWEDWGRADALEVLADAESLVRFDPRRRLLTGHSMGGHGTWILGVLRSDLFAAIAPSAGWVDFWHYGATETPQPADALDAMLRRATAPSRTLTLLRNLEARGVYVLHGDADDNVPVEQARRMREELAQFHPNFVYYERPGAGHWWGSECVDWPPLMEFLKRQVRPQSAPSVAFTTPDLALRDREDWLAIERVQRRSMPASASAKFDAAAATLRITTENAARISIAVRRDDSSDSPRLEWLDGLAQCKVELDGQSLVPRDTHERVWRFERDARAGWSVVEAEGSTVVALPSFKGAFRERFRLVYATGGSAEENAWAAAKARFDAEQFRYRGNASPRVQSDVEWLAEQANDPREHGLVLYGNADIHRAWSTAVEDSAIEVHRGWARVGTRRVEGDDLAVLAVLRSRSGRSCVALISGTGPNGLRTTNHLPYFVSGAGFPDWLVLRTAMLARGLEGIEGAGFFDSEGRCSSEQDEAWRAGSDRR